MTWADDYYYLIAYHERYEKVTQFRVDCMSEIKVSEESIPKEHKLNDFNVVEYSQKVFRMYSGAHVNVELEFDNSLINVVIDRFGKEVTIHSKTETTFHISVEVAVNRYKLSVNDE